jgi:hypothetical protein
MANEPSAIEPVEFSALDKPQPVTGSVGHALDSLPKIEAEPAGPFDSPSSTLTRKTTRIVSPGL